jgi:hypothetical protein
VSALDKQLNDQWKLIDCTKEKIAGVEEAMLHIGVFEIVQNDISEAVEKGTEDLTRALGKLMMCQDVFNVSDDAFEAAKSNKCQEKQQATGAKKKGVFIATDGDTSMVPVVETVELNPGVYLLGGPAFNVPSEAGADNDLDSKDAGKHVKTEGNIEAATEKAELQRSRERNLKAWTPQVKKSQIIKQCVTLKRLTEEFQTLEQSAEDNLSGIYSEVAYTKTIDSFKTMLELRQAALVRMVWRNRSSPPQWTHADLSKSFAD